MTLNDEKVRYFLCCYQNMSSEVAVLRVVRQGKHTVEQKISPGEQLLFSAVAGETASIYSVHGGEESLTETVSCSELRYLPNDDA